MVTAAAAAVNCYRNNSPPGRQDDDRVRVNDGPVDVNRGGAGGNGRKEMYMSLHSLFIGVIWQLIPGI